MTQQDEATFLADYDPTRFPPVAVSVDVAAFTMRDGVLCVLAIERTNHPYLGRLALPSAFPGPREDPYVAGIRGLLNKTKVTPRFFEQLGTYGDPDRDPRMRVYSIAYLAFAVIDEEPVAGYNASRAEWLPVHGAVYEWAFDHEKIVSDAVRRLQDKMEYTPVATGFLPHEFTMVELHAVYAAVWDRAVNAGNFYRKVKASSGFIERVAGKRDKAQLYRAGNAKLLFPPIRRDPKEWS